MGVTRLAACREGEARDAEKAITTPSDLGYGQRRIVLPELSRMLCVSRGGALEDWFKIRYEVFGHWGQTFSW